MTDTLEIFGTEYTGVTGIKATDDNSQTKTYIRPQGTKSISANGTGIDVTDYASVDVSVSGGDDFVITLTYDSQDEIWKPDCTFAQVSAAYIAEKTISAKTDELYCTADIWADGSDYFLGEVVWYDTNEGKLAVDGYTWDANGGWLLDARDYTFVPVLETTARTYTPSTTAQTDTITPSQGYDTSS